MNYVIGYASLLSPVSIRRLFPHAGRIVPVEIPGHARCFNSYGTLSVAQGLAHKDERALAHAAAIFRPKMTLYALAFELGDVDFKVYQRHEFRYDLKDTQVISRETGERLNAIMCYESVDHRIDASLVGFQNIDALYAHYGVNAFWHTQHLPAEVYLSHCLASARGLGDAYVNNVLDTSFIYDRATSVREYLKARGDDVDAYVAGASLSDVF